jgi:hypothetical protein
MIAADFLGDPTGTGMTCPPEWRTDSRKLWAFSFCCNSAQGAGRLHRQHEGGWGGPPMEDVLLAVDLERRPVGAAWN